MNLKIPQATAKGYVEVKPGGAFDCSYPDSKTRRGRVQGDGGDICPTLTCNSENSILIYEGMEDKVCKKIEKPKDFGDVKQIYNSHTLNEILPYLPDEDIFFDTRHWTYGNIDNVLPFALTTRIDANNQQFLKIMKKESQIKQVANIVTTGNYSNPLRGRIYSTEGISPALNCVNGGGQEIKIVQPNVLSPKRTEYGKQIRKAYESGEIKESRHNMTELTPREDGISNTLTSVQKDNLLVLPGKDCRFRKLTPRECFRLMGVSEENIDKIQAAGISNSQQYKLAGNSIVVDTLCHIFRKLFIDKTQEQEQLKLF